MQEQGELRGALQRVLVGWCNLLPSVIVQYSLCSASLHSLTSNASWLVDSSLFLVASLPSVPASIGTRSVLASLPLYSLHTNSSLRSSARPSLLATNSQRVHCPLCRQVHVLACYCWNRYPHHLPKVLRFPQDSSHHCRFGLLFQGSHDVHRRAHDEPVPGWPNQG